MKIIVSENQYKFLIEKYKIEKTDRLKIWETEDFLLVAPLTLTASCKYGANTKWCVTEKDSDMFQKHLEMGELAFFIIKNPEIAKKLGNTKFAYFLKNDERHSGTKSPLLVIYDDTDSVIPQRSLLNHASNMDLYEPVKKSLDEFMKHAERQNKKNKDFVNPKFFGF